MSRNPTNQELARRCHVLLGGTGHVVDPTKQDLALQEVLQRGDG